GLTGKSALSAAARLADGRWVVEHGWSISQPAYHVGLGENLRQLLESPPPPGELVPAPVVPPIAAALPPTPAALDLPVMAEAAAPPAMAARPAPPPPAEVPPGSFVAQAVEALVPLPAVPP